MSYQQRHEFQNLDAGIHAGLAMSEVFHNETSGGVDNDGFCYLFKDDESH